MRRIRGTKGKNCSRKEGKEGCIHDRFDSGVRKSGFPVRNPTLRFVRAKRSSRSRRNRERERQTDRRRKTDRQTDGERERERESIAARFRPSYYASRPSAARWPGQPPRLSLISR